MGQLAIENLRVKDGDPISVDWVDALMSVLIACWTISSPNSGIKIARGANGVSLSTSRPLIALKFFITPSGGIPARNSSTGELGSANCLRYDLTWQTISGVSKLCLTASSPNVSETVLNWSNSAAGNSKMCVVLEVAGSNFLIAEGC